jgi:aarF domain-containing kinase
MAHWAVEGLKVNLSQTPHTLQTIGFRSFAIEKARLLIFRVVLLVVDVGFAITQARQWLFKVFGSKRQEDFESILQRQVSVSGLNVGKRESSAMADLDPFSRLFAGAG